MKNKYSRNPYTGLFLYSLVFFSCNFRSPKNQLEFTDFPKMQIGFSTQNFQKSMPVNVETLAECIEYASSEGYEFIELRDDMASLGKADCETLGKLAKKNKIDVIYEIQINPLDPNYPSVFAKALSNVLYFPGPGIIRSLLSKSEFESDSAKKGWTNAELKRLVTITDSCGFIASTKNIRIIFENLNEPFFEVDSSCRGLSNFFSATSGSGLQFDIGNAFRNSSRGKADPERVSAYLSTLGSRWVTTHLKTLQNGESQPFLTENPLPVEKVIKLMGELNVLYATLELLPVTDKQKCFDNHARSIEFLRSRNILK